MPSKIYCTPQATLLHPRATLEWRQCTNLPVVMLDTQAVVLNNKYQTLDIGPWVSDSEYDPGYQTLGIRLSMTLDIGHWV